jgi:hypothetical protein
VFRNSGYGFVALLVASGFAFWPRYLSRLGQPIDGYTHLHAAVATLWCVLLIVQPFLIRSGRRELHRRLGALAWVAGPLVVVASLLLTNARFRAMDPATFAVEAPNMYLPLQAIVTFAWAWALAMAFRKTQAVHARFMIATGLTLLDPVVGRLLFFYGPPIANPAHVQLVTFGLADAILLALLFRPRMAPRLRRVYALGASVFLVVHLGWFTLAPAPDWRRVAAWFRELPLT